MPTQTKNRAKTTTQPNRAAELFEKGRRIIEGEKPADVFPDTAKTAAPKPDLTGIPAPDSRLRRRPAGGGLMERQPFFHALVAIAQNLPILKALAGRRREAIGMRKYYAGVARMRAARIVDISTARRPRF